MENIRVLADQTRFNLFKLLINNDLCVGALASRLNISKAAASQHLQVLRKAGFVRGEKRGYWTHYSVEKETIRTLASRLVEMIDSASPNGLVCIKARPEENTSQKKELMKMCCNDCCQQPEKLKGTPQECKSVTPAKAGVQK
ncbi:MAG: winged helix-turn-helix transcriptional regulator [Deltaproteobacteria bacterium]|nr:winged helix-turn-helix transcriptional regulator [Deltaproteobacteria bacterium]